MKMKKIVVSSILCAALAATSITSFSAAQSKEDIESGITFDDFFYGYKVLAEENLPDNYVKFYTSGNRIDPTSGVEFTDLSTGQVVLSQYFNTSYGSVTQYLPSAAGYSADTKLNNSSGSINTNLNFTHTGGLYQKVRINLNKGSDYFTANGTYVKMTNNTPHEYNFTKEFNTGYTSSLIFYSGGAITAAQPDKNGYVEIYVSTNIGEPVYFTTDYCYSSPLVSSSGGGVTGQPFTGLTIGDANKNGYVDLVDAILIQKYANNAVTFDELALRCSDVNRDASTNLLDALKLQKFLIKLN
ncbi:MULTISPECIES: dockerin type I repeat-containing protein [unclassified Ruminococcus]|uniref:dockerin type I repeat-containing protein n=1 Tax=unclassified Ruminococcus TaxID=2608920 RepID=UPI00210D24D9|nr:MULTISPECIES: dockerin type I repeat-containing protein [unclassified Ruminococcus]MCQ4021467.1 hypothetical protein [Ruminococcus sp. zg-924]MCQ4113912.1 hypothetical protein [Ruminococcus sp. zg-921]